MDYVINVQNIINIINRQINMFKLEEINSKELKCYINGVLSYIFLRGANGNWGAHKVQDDKSFGSSIDSDRYRYDLAERLDRN